MKRMLRGVLHGSAGLLIFLILWVTFHLKSPYLFAVRSVETPVLLCVTVGLVLFFWFKSRGIIRFVSLGVLLAALLSTVWEEGGFQYRRHAVMHLESEEAKRLGQHFIIGYEDAALVRPLVRHGLIGGVFLSRRNTQGKQFEVLQAEIADLQRLRAEAGLKPLIVATDHEGGMVSHLSPLIDRMPPLSSVVELGETDDIRAMNALAYGETQGRSLARLGVTVNLSPVVDLKSDKGAHSLDFHSLIRQRAISSDPVMTTMIANAYVRGLEKQGVRATLKHFPGLGRVEEDTHHFSGFLDEELDTLESTDWIPFREIGRQSNALLMVGHVILARLDPHNPASFSKAVINGVIRDN